MKRTKLRVACAALWACSAGIAPIARAQEPARVIPVYLVPRDLSFPMEGVLYNAWVLSDVRAWYGRVLGGRTFDYEPLVVQESRHTFAQLAADSFQAWWPLLQDEFADYGWPWNKHSKFKLLFLTHGAGAWAGSDSENGGIDSTSQAGKVDKGNWGGLAVIGDSSVAGVFAKVCPEVAHGKADSTIATAWWCSGSTYRGTVAHELGHTWGLPHPDAFTKGFRCADSTAYTIMQCHWWWEKQALLPYEITHLRSLDFFQFDTAAAYVLLAEAQASSVVRSRSFVLERGDSVVWVDGRGAGTGYPWAVVLAGAGARAEYRVSGTTLAFDLGLQRGSTAAAELRVDLDGKPTGLFAVEPGHAPERFTLPLRGARRITLRVTRGAGRVVLGNARVWR